MIFGITAFFFPLDFHTLQFLGFVERLNEELTLILEIDAERGDAGG